MVSVGIQVPKACLVIPVALDSVDSVDSVGTPVRKVHQAIQALRVSVAPQDFLATPVKPVAPASRAL